RATRSRRAPGRRRGSTRAARRRAPRRRSGPPSSTRPSRRASAAPVLGRPACRAGARGRSPRRAADSRGSPREEGADVAGCQEADALAVGLAASAAERERPQPERPQEEPPEALGLTPPPVLVEEPDLAAQVLDVQPAAVRRAAHVHDLGLRGEEDAPPRPPEARQPVDLLAEHEERLVEEPDRIRGLAAHEQGRRREPVGLALPPVVERTDV